MRQDRQGLSYQTLQMMKPVIGIYAQSKWGQGWRPLLAIAFIAMAANVLTLINPGFFSHDEWQRLDAIQAYGFPGFIEQYGTLKAGPDFGFPVRPIGFLHQGLSALFMQEHPFVSHLMDVLLHVFCAWMLWVMLQYSPLRGRRALVATLIFAVSPLAAFSTAWVGASFDRFYVLFALIAGTGLVRAAYSRLAVSNVVLVVVGSLGAILSKETAVMLPIALLLGAVALKTIGRAPLRPASVIGLLALASTPILVYLSIRLPALQASFSGHVGAYDPSKGDVWNNVYLYFAQPFLLPAVELVSAIFIPKWLWLVAAMLHSLLVLALMCKRGVWSGVLYLAGYFVFLLPVLSLPIVGAHYLYGSGVAFAIGMSLLLPPPSFARPWLDKAWFTLFIGLLALAIAHTFRIERELYQDGACQAMLLDSLDEQIAKGKAQGKRSVQIIPEAGAPGYVAVRSTFGRRPYSAEVGLPVNVQDNAVPSQDVAVLPLRMSVQCKVTRL